MFPFRIYGKSGCKFCMQAEAFFFYKDVPCQMVLSDSDPVVAKGIVELSGQPNPVFPVLVYIPGSEVILGFKEADYERVVGDFRAKHSGSTSDAGAGTGNDPSATATDAPTSAPTDMPVV